MGEKKTPSGSTLVPVCREAKALCSAVLQDSQCNSPVGKCENLGPTAVPMSCLEYKSTGQLKSKGVWQMKLPEEDSVSVKFFQQMQFITPVLSSTAREVYKSRTEIWALPVN